MPALTPETCTCADGKSLTRATVTLEGETLAFVPSLDVMSMVTGLVYVFASLSPRATMSPGATQ